MSKNYQKTPGHKSAANTVVPAQTFLDQAFVHHQKGRMAQAQALYEKVLKTEPWHFDALQLFGYLAYQTSRPQLAVELITKAIVVNPTFAAPYSNLGLALHQLSRFDEAVDNYDKAIGLKSNYAEAHHNRGNALKELKRFTEALASYDAALASNPAFAEAHNGRGNVLTGLDRLEEAVVSYNNALTVKPDYAEARNNLGSALAGLKRFGEAVKEFEKAIALNPRYADAYNNLGYLLMTQGRNRECVPHFCKALELQPSFKEVTKRLSSVYYMLGEIDKAAKMYKQWLKLEPDNPIARHHLAACTREAVPVRAGDAYVESTFDDLADSFDEHLGKLGYRGPELFVEALQRECGDACKQFTVMDAGCGTGLFGPLLSKYAARLVGVDLSAGMLAKAKLRNLYDDLIKAELTAYLQSQIKEFDLILSADTLTYFGALDDVFAAAHSAMREGGHLFFTVEAIVGGDSGSGYRINPHGRYSHGEVYLRHALSNAGFTAVAMEAMPFRTEGGNAVQGFVVSCRAAQIGAQSH